MRYILDNEGYIEELIFGEGLVSCNGVTCTEYTGSVPSGYGSLEEWAELANVQAYYLSDGNLTLDFSKRSELEAQADKEKEENRLVTAKELNDVMKLSYDVTADEFTTTVSGNDLLLLSGAGKHSVPKLKITSTGTQASTWASLLHTAWKKLSSFKWNESSSLKPNVEIVISNRNLLPCNVSSRTVSGLTISQNDSKVLTITGTSTAAIEIPIAGSDTSTDMLFALKPSQVYHQSGLTYDYNNNSSMTLKLYSFDGTNRTLVSNAGEGDISFDSLHKITEAVLCIPSGATFGGLYTTYAIQIVVGTVAANSEPMYVKHNHSHIKIDRPVKNGDVIEINNGSVMLNNELIEYTNGISTVEDCDTGTLNYAMVSIDSDVEVTYYLKDAIAAKVNAMTIENADLYLIDDGTSDVESSKLKVSHGNHTNTNKSYFQQITNESTGAYTWVGSYISSATLSAKYGEKYSAISASSTNSSFLARSSSRETGGETYGNTALYAKVGSTPEIVFRYDGSGYMAGALTQNSRESTKENIAELEYGKALAIVNGTDIREYNYKSDEDKTNKHYGAIIPDLGGDYNTPTEITSDLNDGIDIGSMLGILFKAVQELSAEVDELKGNKDKKEFTFNRIKKSDIQERKISQVESDAE